MKVGIDSYCYHRFLGEVYPHQSEPDKQLTMEDFINRAKELEVDGVSLESAKWAEVLWQDAHTSYWYGGVLDRSGGVSMCIPETYFGHPENEWINSCF